MADREGHRGRRGIRAGLVVGMLAPFVAGCENRCSGPACEAAWPATRLAIHRGDVWERSVNAWAEATALVDGDEAQGADWSVAVAGERIAIGMPEADQVVLAAPPVDGEQDLSADLTWAAASSEFGAEVVWRGADLWVGAPGAALDRGAVYRYSGAAGPDRGVQLVIGGLSPGDRLGERVAACGDLTGDGLPDVVIGAPRFSAPRDGPLSGSAPDLGGAVFVLRSELLPAEGTITVNAAALVMWGEQAGDGAGAAMICDRDRDGDGLVDLIVGAPFAGPDDRGAAYVIGAARVREVIASQEAAGEPPWVSLADASTLTLPGPEAGAWAGWALATGDLTGDGVMDLVIGAPGAGSGAGAVYVYDGASLDSGASAPVTATFVPPDDREGDHAGKSLAIADLDADALPELLIGAPDWREGDAYDVGAVSLWRGSRSFPAGTAVISEDDATLIVGSQPFQRIGGKLILGAYDADGIADDLWLPTRYGGR